MKVSSVQISFGSENNALSILFFLHFLAREHRVATRKSAVKSNMPSLQLKIERIKSPGEMSL